MNRRKFLVAGTFVGVCTTTGCLGRFFGGDAEDSEEENEQENRDTDDMTENDAASDSDQHDDEGTETDPATEKDKTEDKEEDPKDLEDPYPDEEDTEIDRDQYDDPPDQPKREERDSDDVEVKASYSVGDYGGLTIDGTVTNISDEPVDEVALEINVFDPDDEYLWGDSVGIQNIEPGASETFESGWTADEERGEVDHVEIDPMVYDVVEDENSDGNEDKA